MELGEKNVGFRKEKTDTSKRVKGEETNSADWKQGRQRANNFLFTTKTQRKGFRVSAIDGSRSSQGVVGRIDRCWAGSARKSSMTLILKIMNQGSIQKKRRDLGFGSSCENKRNTHTWVPNQRWWRACIWMWFIVERLNGLWLHIISGSILEEIARGGWGSTIVGRWGSQYDEGPRWDAFPLGPWLLHTTEGTQRRASAGSKSMRNVNMKRMTGSPFNWM